MINSLAIPRCFGDRTPDMRDLRDVFNAVPMLHLQKEHQRRDSNQDSQSW
jgi:hypothetical protein